MREQRYCIICKDPISVNAAHGVCMKCAMIRHHAIQRLREIETGIHVQHGPNFIKPNYKYYGIHPVCKGCPHDCKCYAAPNSVIVECRATWERDGRTERGEPLNEGVRA